MPIFLPLLNSRDVLIVLECLSFAFKNKDFIMYSNAKRSVNAAQFRKEILFQFTANTVEDIQMVFARTKTEKYKSCPTFLEQAILYYDDSLPLNYVESLSKEEIMHWRLFFGKMLLSA